MSYEVPAGTTIGHVHLKVAAIDRALAFYQGVLGLISRCAWATASLSFRPAVIIITSDSTRGTAAAARRRLRTTRVCIISRFGTRRGAPLPWPFARVIDAGIPLQGVADHFVSEAVYLTDLDGKRDRACATIGRSRNGRATPTGRSA